VVHKIGEIEGLQRKAFYLEVISSFAAKLLGANSSDDIAWLVAKHAVGKLGYVDCIVYLLDEKKSRLYQRAAHGPKNPVAFDIENPIVIKMGKGIVGSVAKTGVGEIVGDTSLDARYIIDDENRASEITIPILAKNEVIGIIDSEHPDKNFFSQDDFEVLTTIASMTSAKLGQVKIQEELQMHKRLLEDKVKAKTQQLQMTILELRKSNREILDRDKEKEILLREIHHRVKNNLQILTSLMNLQASVSNNDVVKGMLKECQRRILSMAAIHEQLYMGGNMAEIEVRSYMVQITDSILHSFGASERVNLIINVGVSSFDIATSIPLGLMVNELVVNALKHGLKDVAGELSISVSCEGDSVVLIVRDNGSGFDTSVKKSGSLGMELIKILTEQLEGEVTFDSGESGTTCRLAFPARQFC